jgi:glutamate racemase
MQRLQVLVLDSGMGGLPYLATILEALTPLTLAVQIDYLADNLAFPYGIKPKDELQARLTQLAAEIAACKRYHCVVIACNTASIYGEAIFSQHFSANQLVVTTPKLLLEQHPQQQNFYLLATSATCHAYDHTPNLFVLPADNLVRWVEKERPLLPLAAQKEYLASLKNSLFHAIAPHSTIILGCTHFLHLRPLLEQIFPDLVFVDTRHAVAMTLITKLTSQYPAAPQGCVQAGKLYLTAPHHADASSYQQIAKEYHLEYTCHRLKPA